MLSGFLLSRGLAGGAPPTAAPRPETGHYLWKRALRIVPVYLVAVAWPPWR